jgi:hypothetical protein
VDTGTVTCVGARVGVSSGAPGAPTFEHGTTTPWPSSTTYRRNLCVRRCGSRAEDRDCPSPAVRSSERSWGVSTATDHSGGLYVPGARSVSEGRTQW